MKIKAELFSGKYEKIETIFMKNIILNNYG